MELWKDIPNFEGKYQVSNMGRVKAVPHNVKAKGNSYRIVGERILKPARGKFYMQVSLGKHHSFTVQRLVMLAFAGSTPDGMEIMHLNSDPTDNRLCNLTFGTHSENMVERVRQKRSYRQRLTTEDVREIKQRLANGDLQRVIAEDYKVTRQTISGINTGKNFYWIK
jgi:hypothetical protein